MADEIDFDEPRNEAATSSGSREPENRARRAPATANQVEGDAREVHLLDYVRILYKRRYLAITVFLVIVGAVAVYTFTATPIFEARASLLIEVDNPNVVDFKQVIDEQQAKADYYQTQYNLLQSRSLARKTLDSLKLWENPYFAPTASAKGSGFFAWIGGFFGGGTAAQGDNLIPAADETTAQSRAIDAFLGHLSIAPVRNSRLVDVKYDLPDARLATQITNALTANYINQILEYKFLASKDASDWLADRLKEQRAQVEAAESALQKYRENNDAISVEDRQNITVQKLSDLNAAVTRAKTVRIEKQALYDQLKAAQGNPDLLDTFPAILTNGFIQQLKGQLSDLQRQKAQLAEKFGEIHPQIIAVNSAIANAQTKLDLEIKKVVQSVKSEYDAAASQESSLTAALNQQKGEAQSMNRKAIDYGVLERDVESSKGIYTSLLQTAKETGVSGQLRTSNIRVVDAAETPRSPASPNKRLNLLAGILGGMFLSGGLAFFFEYVDSSIKNPDDIKAHLGLPSLGLLPKIDDKALAGMYPLLSRSVPPNFAESFRAIRTNVLFSSTDGGSKSIVVTSTGPGEGKSVVASNLAVSLAQAGTRVLLVDADMRKPKAQDIFEVPQEPGLSNVLVGNAKASDAVRKSGVPGLWLLPAGRIPPNPAELLGSPRLREFIASLGQHFDWIIVDTPPVMAVTDAALVAHSVTGVLYVVGAEMTSRHAAARGLDQLENAQAKFIGAVLNRVDLERNAYYYSQYYRREYTHYYASRT
jgi:capsular exopolysaccharide synthesis family protein